MSDRSNRTEQATAQRIRKAREEGRFVTSREFVASLQLLVFSALATWLASFWWTIAQEGLRAGLRGGFLRADLSEVPPGTLYASLLRLPIPLLAAGGALFSAGLLAQLAITGFGLAPSRLSPDLNRLNPVQKLSGLWTQNRRSAAEAVVLLALVAAVIWAEWRRVFVEELTLSRMPVRSAVLMQGKILSGLLWKAALLLFAWGALDLWRARRRYFNELKMTKQEIREEHKQNEGNPEVKMRIRRLRRELLRRRMMAQVAHATAVVTNPTHYAVALKYEFGAMSAPRVVAKGKNFLALRIRQKAAENRVPVIENPPLARSLYQNVQVGSEIPAHLYRAVAEVLAYVFRTLGWTPGKEAR